jgi:hypothetical protein
MHTTQLHFSTLYLNLNTSATGGKYITTCFSCTTPQARPKLFSWTSNSTSFNNLPTPSPAFLARRHPARRDSRCEALGPGRYTRTAPPSPVPCVCQKSGNTPRNTDVRKHGNKTPMHRGRPYYGYLSQFTHTLRLSLPLLRNYLNVSFRLPYGNSVRRSEDTVWPRYLRSKNICCERQQSVVVQFMKWRETVRAPNVPSTWRDGEIRNKTKYTHNINITNT